MRIGIIDLGTNSVRFDIHQLAQSKKPRLIHREKLMVRLGQGVFLGGNLDPSAIRRTLHAFEKFKKIAMQFRAGKILAFGTSALREVVDQEKFVKTITDRTGIALRVISGEEEAKLIALGILANEKLGRGKFALVDIGGGSTEISICQGKQVLHSASFPLGTARLQQVFLKKSPPDAKEVEELRRSIRGTLYQQVLVDRWPKVDRIIGSSGTIRALARILKKGGKEIIEKRRLKELVREMGSMTISELLGVPGMEAKRVDMILGGAVLLEEIIEVLGVKKGIATEFSLRDGILEEEAKLFTQGEKSHLGLHLEDLYQKAQLFGGEAQHLKRVVELGEKLFAQLRSVHGLDPQWKIYLLAGLILRDTGEAVSLAHYWEHSSYIVENSDLPGMEAWEQEFVAKLCLHHEGLKFDPKKLPFASDKVRASAFMKLLAVMRIVDSLDSGPEAVVQVRSVRSRAGVVEIQFTGTRLTGLEALNIESKSALFEKVFKRTLVAKQV